MLQHILAVITASVSLAGCSTGSKEPMERLSHTVKRPVVDHRPDDNASRDHVGSQAATAHRWLAAQAGTTAAAPGTGDPGSNEGETSARGSSLPDSTPAAAPRAPDDQCRGALRPATTNLTPSDPPPAPRICRPAANEHQSNKIIGKAEGRREWLTTRKTDHSKASVARREHPMRRFFSSASSASGTRRRRVALQFFASSSSLKPAPISQAHRGCRRRLPSPKIADRVGSYNGKYHPR